MSIPPQQTAIEMGAQIRRAREGAGMTVQELARRAGITEAQMSAIERGELIPIEVKPGHFHWDHVTGWRMAAILSVIKESKQPVIKESKQHHDLDNDDLDDEDLDDDDLDDDDLDDLDDDELDDEEWPKDDSGGINWLADRLLSVADGLRPQERKKRSPLGIVLWVVSFVIAFCFVPYVAWAPDGADPWLFGPLVFGVVVAIIIRVVLGFLSGEGDDR